MKRMAFTFIVMIGLFIRGIVIVAKTEVSLLSRAYIFLLPCCFFAAIIAAVLSVIFDQDDVSMWVLFWIIYAILMIITVVVI